MLPISIMYPKGSYLVEPFNMRLLWFDASGLMKYWVSADTDMKFMSQSALNVGPKTISIQHLAGIFQIWIAFCGIACLVFIVEIFYHYREKAFAARIRNSQESPQERHNCSKQ
jgi:hypothetical protein